MITKSDHKKNCQKKHLRIRKNINGTTERPRLAVYRSSKHMYAQLIDDTQGTTIVSASTLEASIKSELEYGGNVGAAYKIGQILAEKALKNGIKEVIFDRGGNTYHGRVKAVAEGAREAGLVF
ncbi:MAG: 50S ribosomal protein L18 [Clostridia bacterium]|nr:50S ribosomal protein L18 [Clostridia bacterium]MDD4047365.1 50S ribosomal protein L18 [Clostridia bacterium]